MPPTAAPNAAQSARILAFDPTLARPGLLARIDQLRVEIARIMISPTGKDCDPRVAPARVSDLLETAHAAFFEDIESCAQTAIDISILSVYAVHNGAWGSKELLPDLMRLQEIAVRLTENRDMPGKHIVLG